MLVGHMKEIIRHPVKSFYGESVERTSVMKYGLYGDRSHALLDATRPGKYMTITQYPEMARYKARFAGEESIASFPKLEIITPEGKAYSWEDKALVNAIEQAAKREIIPISYFPDHVPFGAIEEEHLQLVTDASVRKLEGMWGEKIDYRRFRPNLLLSLQEQTPFIEEEWFGKRLKIGSKVEIEVKRHCERCMIISVDPENAKRTPSLHKTVIRERNNNFGVYASVIKTGEIQVGDEVHLVE